MFKLIISTLTHFELQPHLIGELVELRPLRPDDWEALYSVASDPAIWEGHPASDRYREDVFRGFFRGTLDSGGAFVVLDRKSGQMIGSTRFGAYDPERGEIEIGGTFLARSHWGGTYNGEVKRLMLGHAFRFVENVIFLIGATNLRSRRSIEKLSAQLTDRRITRSLNGQAIEHLVYEVRKGQSSRFRSFELQPHLIGGLVELRPLGPEDWDALFAVAADPLIWELHPASDRYRKEVFRQFFKDALESGGALAVLDRETGKIIGSSRYYGYDPELSEIEIGWTFLARSYWGGEYNGEMKRLMLTHAFRFAENVIFLVGTDNLRSRRALEKIGAVLTNRHEDKTLQGRVIHHVVYQIRRSDYV